MASVTDIVGYAYQAETLCPACAVMACAEELAPGPVPTAALLDPEAGLDYLAQVAGIEDREDEGTFDSDDFPKVIFRDSARENADTCAYDGCGVTLAE